MSDEKENPGLDERLKDLDPQEIYNIKALMKRMQGGNITPVAVGKTLPEAVLIGDEGSQRLSKSMTGITERSIAASVEENPEALTTALFPIIGSAIRKALEKFLAEFMDSMNRGLEKTLSVKRLQWRYESIKTGVPYLEIVLRETIQYRVEHVFLIHKKTGILIKDVSIEGKTGPDSDMVAPMLSVIRDYIKDSMALKKSEEVDSIKAGAHTIMVEDGPYATLALFVRGNADIKARTAAQEVLETVHLRYGSVFKAFSGNMKPFDGVESLLKRCLISQGRQSEKKKPVYAISLLSIILLAFLTFGILGIVSGQSRKALIKSLDAEPGIVVVSSKTLFGKTKLKLLQDPRAKMAQDVASSVKTSLLRYTLVSEPYLSPLFSDSMPANKAVPEELLALGRKLAEIVLYFEQDSDELRTGQEGAVREAGNILSELIGKSAAYGFSTSVDIVGHAAGNVQDEAALLISDIRAKKAFALFAEINTHLVNYVKALGLGISEPLVPIELTEEDRIKNRSVTFKAIFEQIK